MYDTVKKFFAGITELGLLLVVMSVVATIIFGNNIPFVGGIAANTLALIKNLGGAGVVGLIAAAAIVWLLGKKG
ncbi:MAG: hypothetical protein HQ503_10260 [Rhodospirillales bacterium]|nr:hypothetical protein [Rhodospirillales bacterium]